MWLIWLWIGAIGGYFLACLMASAKDRRIRCPECGHEHDFGRCPNCGSLEWAE